MDKNATQTINALNDAALAISEGLSLPRTLQKIADTARNLVKTRYAALGVLEHLEGSGSYELKQFITSGLAPQQVRHIQHEPHGRGLLGAIFRESQPININSIREDSRSAGFCESHPFMTSFLGVPITNRDRHLGNLYLCDRLDGQPFDQRDEEMVRLLASHAAIAIENARLHEELQAVALRAERDRIGMELHDGVIQSIYAVGMKMEIIASKVTMTPEIAAQYQTLLHDLNQIIDDIRAYIRNLLSAHEEQTTLRQKVENLVEHFQDFSGVVAKVSLNDGLPILSDYQRHNMLQILRELLANIARHAGATRASIHISYLERELMMVVEDDGHGFEPTAAGGAPQLSTSHFGMKNIHQRAQRLGGSLITESAPGKGTRVTLRFPAGFDKGVS